MASTLDLLMPFPVLSPQWASRRKDLRTPPSMTVRLPVGVPSSSKAQDSGAGTDGSSTMVRHPDATSPSTESLQGLLPYITFSPFTAAPTEDMSMSPSCPGGSIMDSVSWPSYPLASAESLACLESDAPMSSIGMSRRVPWNVSTPSPGCSPLNIDVKWPYTRVLSWDASTPLEFMTLDTLADTRI